MIWSSRVFVAPTLSGAQTREKGSSCLQGGGLYPDELFKPLFTHHTVIHFLPQFIVHHQKILRLIRVFLRAKKQRATAQDKQTLVHLNFDSPHPHPRTIQSYARGTHLKMSRKVNKGNSVQKVRIMPVDSSYSSCDALLTWVLHPPSLSLSQTLFVKKVPVATSEIDLVRACNAFGTVQQVMLVRSKRQVCVI
jgi:hypothetical protein